MKLRCFSWRRMGCVIALPLLCCSMNPVSMKVQAGSTVLIPVSGEDEGVHPGFGSEITKANQDFDDQRGELVFYLRGPVRLPEAQQQDYPLRTRYVTRVFPDPSTGAGYAGQVMALADVPAPTDTPAGPLVAQDEEFRLLVLRRSRDLAAPGTPYGPVTPYFAASSGAPDLRLIVTPGVGTPNPDEAWLGNAMTSGLMAQAGLYQEVPPPQLLIRLGNTDEPGGENPSAASLDVTYPEDKLTVVGVAEWANPGRGSIVRWKRVSTGLLRIWMADPDRSVDRIGIAFRLVDPLVHGRTAPSEFTIVQSKLFRSNGSPYSPSSYPAIVEIR